MRAARILFFSSNMITKDYTTYCQKLYPTQYEQLSGLNYDLTSIQPWECRLPMELMDLISTFQHSQYISEMQYILGYRQSDDDFRTKLLNDLISDEDDVPIDDDAVFVPFLNDLHVMRLAVYFGFGIYDFYFRERRGSITHDFFLVDSNEVKCRSILQDTQLCSVIMSEICFRFEEFVLNNSNELHELALQYWHSADSRAGSGLAHQHVGAHRYAFLLKHYRYLMEQKWFVIRMLQPFEYPVSSTTQHGHGWYNDIPLSWIHHNLQHDPCIQTLIIEEIKQSHIRSHTLLHIQLSIDKPLPRKLFSIMCAVKTSTHPL
jgi:hypothetical protein